MKKTMNYIICASNSVASTDNVCSPGSAVNVAIVAALVTVLAAAADKSSSRPNNIRLADPPPPPETEFLYREYNDK